jgi:replication fork protection complex subunit Tof1/Swi1
MTLIGFTRLGEASDPDASWIIPSSLTAADLEEAIDLIRKFEFDPPVYENGKTAEDHLRSKAAAARQSTRKVDFDDDSDGIERDSEEDRGEYAPDGPTARQPSARKILKRRRRERTPVELDEEEQAARAEARRKKELEKLGKVKSTMFVHDSDDESDEERDRAFFAKEQAIRDGTGESYRREIDSFKADVARSKKRKSDDPPKKKSKRRKSPPKRRVGPFDTDESENDEERAISISSRASSEEAANLETDGGEEETTDTPLSSQHAAMASISEGEDSVEAASSKQRDVLMADADEEDDDMAPVARRPAARNVRAGFVIDSDSE